MPLAGTVSGFSSPGLIAATRTFLFLPAVQMTSSWFIHARSLMPNRAAQPMTTPAQALMMKSAPELSEAEIENWRWRF